MNRAIFLDRDGVINNPKKNYYVYRVEDFQFNKGIIEALQYFQNRDYMLIVITNQGGISKGKYTEKDVEAVHDYMKRELASHEVYLTEIYFCPHHSKNERCLCRKPEPLMIEKAISRFDIDPDRSWFIGDKKTDAMAGELAGVKTLKIRKNQNLMKIIDKIS